MIREQSSISPSGEIDPKQFGVYASERRELAGIFDPLATIAAGRIEDAIDQNPDAVRERLSEVSSVELPYGDTYLRLPPGLLEGKEPTLEPPVDSGYSKFNWFDNLMRDYVRTRQQHGTPYEKERYPGEDGDVDPMEWPPEIEAFNVPKLFRGFNPDGWKKYETAYLRCREEGREAELYELIDHRARNSTDHYAMPAEYRSFMYARADLENDNRIAQNIVVPVGEYGEAYANTLLKSTLFMIEALDTVIEKEAEEVTNGHRQLLEDFTARGGEEKSGVTARSTTLTIQEGVLSIMQTVALLTADKVAGYEDPGRLLHDIISQGLIEKVTRLMPAALVGPVTLTGKYFPHPIERSLDGSLTLTAGFTDWLHEAHAQYWQLILRQKEISGSHPKGISGLTCPASGKGGGIGVLATTLDRTYQVIATE